MAANKAEAQYDKVRTKIDNGMGVVQAIQAVAKEEKLKPGSIQTAYYRIARQKGETRSARVQNMRMQAKSLSPQNGQQNTVAIMDSIRAALDGVIAQVRSLEQDSERLHEIEGMLTK